MDSQSTRPQLGSFLSFWGLRAPLLPKAWVGSPGGGPREEGKANHVWPWLSDPFFCLPCTVLVPHIWPLVEGQKVAGPLKEPGTPLSRPTQCLPHCLSQ